jgi:hypothetical protein
VPDFGSFPERESLTLLYRECVLFHWGLPCPGLRCWGFLSFQPPTPFPCSKVSSASPVSVSQTEKWSLRGGEGTLSSWTAGQQGFRRCPVCPPPPPQSQVKRLSLKSECTFPPATQNPLGQQKQSQAWVSGLLAFTHLSGTQTGSGSCQRG